MFQFDASRAKKYRKRPVVIEAYQTEEEVVIPTLEGDLLASPGDYIIRGLRGECYPCKPDIFAKTYEVVSEEKAFYEEEPDHRWVDSTPWPQSCTANFKEIPGSRIYPFNTADAGPTLTDDGALALSVVAIPADPSGRKLTRTLETNRATLAQLKLRPCVIAKLKAMALELLEEILAGEDDYPVFEVHLDGAGISSHCRLGVIRDAIARPAGRKTLLNLLETSADDLLTVVENA